MGGAEGRGVAAVVVFNGPPNPAAIWHNALLARDDAPFGAQDGVSGKDEGEGWARGWWADPEAADNTVAWMWV